MKVAIVGAGVSGLACAIALEKYGIVPDVFEQMRRPGDIIPFVQSILKVLYRQVADPVSDLADTYGIGITPINVVEKIVMYSQNKVATAEGAFGYSFLRGHGANTLDCELYGKLAGTRVRFNTMAGWRELAREYDHVVVATGSPFFAMDAGCWSGVLRGWARGAVMEGIFDPTTMKFWFNKSYAHNGYAYLAPISAQKASLVLEVSDVREDEVESMWRRFLATEKIEYRESQGFLREHSVGICFPRQFDNVLFVGIAAGLLDYMTGAALYNAVISGVLAAQSIYEGSSYEYKIRNLLKRSYYSYLIRLRLNGLGNNDFDKMLRVLSFPPLNRVVYNTNIDLIEILGNSFKLLGKGALRDKFLD